MGHRKTTSKHIAKRASKALRSTSTSKATKKLAGSALSQSKGKHKKRK